MFRCKSVTRHRLGNSVPSRNLGVVCVIFHVINTFFYDYTVLFSANRGVSETHYTLESFERGLDLICVSKWPRFTPTVL